MDEKTKEIVERLQKVLDAPESWREHDTEALSVAIVPVQDILDAVIELKNNASLIERLSERVGELERLWGERCMTEMKSQSDLLSKQEERKP